MVNGICGSSLGEAEQVIRLGKVLEKLGEGEALYDL